MAYRKIRASRQLAKARKRLRGRRSTKLPKQPRPRAVPMNAKGPYFVAVRPAGINPAASDPRAKKGKTTS